MTDREKQAEPKEVPGQNTPNYFVDVDTLEKQHQYQMFPRPDEDVNAEDFNLLDP